VRFDQCLPRSASEQIGSGVDRSNHAPKRHPL